jgi:hypothetical protein
MPWQIDVEHWQVVRPQVVLLAAQGLHNDEIAERVNCRREVIDEWREGFYAQRPDGLRPSGSIAGRAAPPASAY